MKKTRHEKSRDTAPLSRQNIFNMGKNDQCMMPNIANIFSVTVLSMIIFWVVLSFFSENAAKTL
jgi:hypothetical protein